MGIGEWEPLQTLKYGTPVELLINRFGIAYPMLSSVFAFVIAIVVVSMMHRLNNRYIFIPQRSVIPILLFVVISFSFISLQHLTSALVAMPLLILSLNSIFASYRKDYAEGEFFLASFFLGLASIVYLPSLIFILMIIFSILVMRPFSWREWVAMLAGVVVPLLFLVTYYIFFDENALQLLESLSSDVVISAIPKKMNNFFGYGFFAVLTIAAFYASFFLLSWIGTQKVRTNKIFLVFYSMIFIGGIAYFVVPTVSKEIMLVVSLPLSYILGVFLIFTRRTFAADAILITILLLSVLLQLFVE